MKCDGCGGVFPGDLLLYCLDCGQGLSPDIELGFRPVSPLVSGQPGVIEARIANHELGWNILEAVIELRSPAFGHGQHPREPLGRISPLERKEGIRVPVQAGAAGDFKLTAFLHCRLDARVECVGLCGHGQIAVRAVGSSSQQVNISGEEVNILSDIRLDGGTTPVEWSTLPLRVDKGATTRTSSLLRRQCHCPYCDGGIRRDFHACPACGMSVPSYLTAEPELFGHSLRARTPPEALVLRPPGAAPPLRVVSKSQLWLGRHRSCDIRVLVEPRTPENDRLSERISRQQALLEVEEETFLLRVKPAGQTGQPTAETLRLDQPQRIPLGDGAVVLDCEPFVQPARDWAMALRIGLSYPDALRGSRQGTQHLVLHRWIDVAADRSRAPVVVGPGKNGLFRLIRHDHHFWVEALHIEEPVQLDDEELVPGEIGLLLPGQHLTCGPLRFQVEAPEAPLGRPSGDP